MIRIDSYTPSWKYLFWLCDFLFPNDLDQHPLTPVPVEFPIKNLLPGAKIQLSPGLPWAGQAQGDRHHHLAAHHLGLPQHSPAPNRRCGVNLRLPQHESLGLPQHENLRHDVGVSIVLTGAVTGGGSGWWVRTVPAAPARPRNPGWKWPDSSSLMKTEAVMCMAFTSASQYL